MLIMFEPDPPVLRCCRIDDQLGPGEVFEFIPRWDENADGNLGNIQDVKGFGYVLSQGGERITRPAGFLSPRSLHLLEEVVPLRPEQNGLSAKAVRYWMERCPKVPHMLFCETAFFVDLPPTASTYAVPYELRGQGIKRYGGYGLCHEWVWEQAQLLLGDFVRSVVSVYLGDHTNVAAIADGKPVETTMGFTPVEGILSAGGCGDIDPTIVFELRTAGMSLEGINRVLSSESGLAGLAGRRCSFLDLMKAQKDPALATAREILQHSIISYIGAFVAVLSRVDAVVFVSEHPRESREFIRSLCQKLGPLGPRFKVAEAGVQPDPILTEVDSPVSVLCLGYNGWTTMAAKFNDLLAKRGKNG
jgi:acetate kinase